MSKERFEQYVFKLVRDYQRLVENYGMDSKVALELKSCIELSIEVLRSLK